MSKDFDAERSVNGKKPETFKVGGETFTVRPVVSANVLADFGHRQVANFGDTLEAYDKFVKSCIPDDEGEKWDKVRAEADPPLTVNDVEQIVWWLMDLVTGRPIEASSSSRRGRAAQAAT